jgi:hypothetical protein
MTPRGHGVDLVLLYGLRCFWGADVDRPGYYAVVPPFIEEVTPPEALPVPPRFLDRPDWVVIVGFDERVLRGGIELIASVDSQAAVVAVSREPRAAQQALAAAGIDPERGLALPLQADADMFGLMARSRTAVVANGFMHIAEALALGCPALCIDRGIGMSSWSLHRRFLPYVSISESAREQRARLQGWLQGCPFPPELLQRLQHERNGARVSADHLEAVADRPRLGRRLQRLGARVRDGAASWSARRAGEQASVSEARS